MVLLLPEKKIQLNTNKILYKDWIIDLLYNPKLKHSYIKITADLKIVVKTANKSTSFVHKLLEEKEPWIQKQLSRSHKMTLLDFNLEDEVLLFGERYSIDSEEATFLRTKLFRVKDSSKDRVLRCYDEYYKELCHNYLTQRVDFFSQRMNLSYSSLRYRKMRSRWGSCSSRRIITLNSELLKLKKELIDYVIVHELSHLVHMNHSASFHNLVESYLPHSKILRKELKSLRLL